MSATVKRFDWSILPGAITIAVLAVGITYTGYIAVFDHSQWKDRKAGLINYCREEHPEVFQHCLYMECMLDTAGSTRCKEFRRRGY